ncbi:MAG: type II toxin-antitoxin system RelE/ParE family toxin [Alphaproteobacteria bacterium]|nr:type II toxin-antitoxin system RelE/ParE family toxin [Alphaproteobacteria bacterium]
MTFPVVYRRAASDDIDEAMRWLGERSPAAAIDFLRAIARAETHLRRTPLIYQVVRTDVRRAHLKPFRYGLYFRVVEDRVLVIACLHASRSPSAIGNVLRDRR